MSIALTQLRYTVEEYEAMTERGELTENDRVELIRGEIIEKMPIGSSHTGCVNKLNRLLNRLVGDNAIVTIQNSIQLADSEPEPDVCLARLRADFYSSSHPRPADIFLIIEVAESSLEFDQQIKTPLYAENGIAEYWIVNLNDDCVEVHRDPTPAGQYRDVQTVRAGQTIPVPGIPGAVLDPAQFL